jgi:hypothetical protein
MQLLHSIRLPVADAAELTAMGLCSRYLLVGTEDGQLFVWW